MRPKFHLRFVDKSAAALNLRRGGLQQAVVRLPEETFAILALNAWELLLKAKVLKEANDAVKAASRLRVQAAEVRQAIEEGHAASQPRGQRIVDLPIDVRGQAGRHSRPTRDRGEGEP